MFKIFEAPQDANGFFVVLQLKSIMVNVHQIDNYENPYKMTSVYVTDYDVN